MARNVPFVMTTFTTMDWLKRYILLQRKKAVQENVKGQKTTTTTMMLSTVDNLVIGISSALFAGLLTNPVDVVKTRMMTQAASNAAVPYSSALDCFINIVKTEGPLTLFSGLKQRSLYMGLLWGMTFAVNGAFERKFQNNQEQEL
eukprot:CAMPEP_0116569700 /NCGR_PEP_ID=MMETSP0397-20121206/16472_1 /TAXON_ID=216820 /ORGANISM="Cyclophora tenuis, Strain ECT3854" /LENGTH=144 /DNA_ID=CAMNT_0004097359 /DNA_START=693 /DNA_END=1127 /DNA_ORIENTATION=+